MGGLPTAARMHAQTAHTPEPPWYGGRAGEEIWDRPVRPGSRSSSRRDRTQRPPHWVRVVLTDWACSSCRASAEIDRHLHRGDGSPADGHRHCITTATTPTAYAPDHERNGRDQNQLVEGRRRRFQNELLRGTQEGTPGSLPQARGTSTRQRVTAAPPPASATTEITDGERPHCTEAEGRRRDRHPWKSTVTSDQQRQPPGWLRARWAPICGTSGLQPQVGSGS